jgi:sulfur carrier protein ThiS
LKLEEGTTLADLLNELGIERKVVISGNDAHESDRLRQLHDGDKVMTFTSVSGGFFPAELKFAGFDAIVIKGKAESRFIFGSTRATTNCAMHRIYGGRSPCQR